MSEISNQHEEWMKQRHLNYFSIAQIANPRSPYSIRILLENVLRHQGAGSRQVQSLINWKAASKALESIDVFATRAFLHDTNGVPVLTDLAAMRDAVVELGLDPALVNPVIPAELTVDHSVIADFHGSPDATEKNITLEFQRNEERFRFLKWGQQNLENFKVVPPGSGIMHQINCEYLARVVEQKEGFVFPDLCLGTDSHTTMVNGVGVLAWGIGGIEAEAVMLGEAYSMLVPEVIGIKLVGKLQPGTTATDLVLTITQTLRRLGVVGKFVEFFGPSISSLSVADRTTIANMAPEFGSSIAYFPIDQATIEYLVFTGRSNENVERVEHYAKLQGLWHDENLEPDYDQVVEIDLTQIEPSIAGPRRPQDRVALSDAKSDFERKNQELARNHPSVKVSIHGNQHELKNGIVAAAAITSCTNTSNPRVMVAAGLLAKRAAELGLKSKPWVKTTLSPGSKVVTDYLDKAGLTKGLEQLGFYLTGYGCMTCIGASGGLLPEIEHETRTSGLEVAAVLSGNRNFDGRINPDVRFNYLASPPLVVAYALAGTMDFDFATQPLGQGVAERSIYLSDLWPSEEEIDNVINSSIEPSMYVERYSEIFGGNQLWQDLPSFTSATYNWEPSSTYLKRPPFMDGMSKGAPGISDIVGARVLAMLGDQITTDHLSPAGAIPAGSLAGGYLAELGVPREQLNTYASRRGNFEVMMRGTLANVRLKNQLVPELEGNNTLNLLSGEVETIYETALNYKTHGIPSIILGGKNYGAGSSRDWGAKGPALLGVKAVIAESFERIHRSNLVCMGILPLQYLDGESTQTLGLTGHESFSIENIENSFELGEVLISANDKKFKAKLRVETERERQYLIHGGVLPFVLRKLVLKG